MVSCIATVREGVINDDVTDTSTNSSMLIIGAPTEVATSSQPNTERPGAIYSCPFSSNTDDCTRVNMDQGQSQFVVT